MSEHLNCNIVMCNNYSYLRSKLKNCRLLRFLRIHQYKAKTCLFIGITNYDKKSGVLKINSLSIRFGKIKNDLNVCLN